MKFETDPNKGIKDPGKFVWAAQVNEPQSVGQPLPGPAEDDRPRKIDGKFSTKGLPTT